jgi:hypothetical protein
VDMNRFAGNGRGPEQTIRLNPRIEIVNLGLWWFPQTGVKDIKSH